jgi:7-carboxy-7-deazaguanine synthase
MISVKEIFSTLQGEGSKAGTPAVFVRLSGCNLWSGIEENRSSGKGTCSEWCDTDFAHGDKMEVNDLVSKIIQCADEGGVSRSIRWLVVITGGEPILQLKKPDGILLLEALADRCTVAVETNGTVAIGSSLAALLDHITVSPKPLKANPTALDHIVVRTGTDLKVTVPSPWSTDDLIRMGEWVFKHRFVQAIDKEGESEVNMSTTIALASALGWRVSIQTHKLLGLP